MRDVRGYEEKDPVTLQQLTSGYPRFVVHPFAKQLGHHVIATTPSLAGQTLWLTTSPKMARDLAAYLRSAGDEAQVYAGDRIHGVSHPPKAETYNLAKTYLQNLGGFLSSREAEDHLVRLKLIPSTYTEELSDGNAPAEVSTALLRALPGATAADLFLAPSGMSAIHAAFRACANVQAARGRTAWLQLGWLYLDTIAILKKFTSSPADYVYVRDPLDFAGIERIFNRFGDKIAGVFAEVPTNPLIETPALDKLAALCRQHGAKLIVDPTIVSIFDVDVLAHADIVASSVTKYAASEGDVLAGFCAVNPAGSDAAALRQQLAAEIEPAYSRDIARLAVEIRQVDAVMKAIHANTAKVAAFLENHPAVRDVFWALHPASRENFLRLARRPDATGGMITFTLKGDLTRFYDRLRLPKGPSFGMKTTLICPFMYLAHYDLVTTPAGIAELAASRLDPDLLRLCCGTEPVEEIIGSLDEALRA